MSNDNDRRRPYGGNRPQGAGRRTYPDAAGPRVGRIERDVPRARQVSADEDYSIQTGETYSGNAARRAPSASLHHGSAYRAPSGPRRYKREPDAVVEAEIPENETCWPGATPSGRR